MQRAIAILLLDAEEHLDQSNYVTRYVGIFNRTDSCRSRVVHEVYLGAFSPRVVVLPEDEIQHQEWEEQQAQTTSREMTN